jgi:hypothetical protein
MLWFDEEYVRNDKMEIDELPKAKKAEQLDKNSPTVRSQAPSPQNTGPSKPLGIILKLSATSNNPADSSNVSLPPEALACIQSLSSLNIPNTTEHAPVPKKQKIILENDPATNLENAAEEQQTVRNIPSNQLGRTDSPPDWSDLMPGFRPIISSVRSIPKSPTAKESKEIWERACRARSAQRGSGDCPMM